MHYNTIADYEYVYLEEIDIKDFVNKYMKLTTKLKSKKWHVKDKKSNAKYYDSSNIITFDTETHTDIDKELAWTYRQMIEINESPVLFTRTMEEVGIVLNEIDNWYRTNGIYKIKNFRSVIWVHNLSYDFQFLRDCCEFKSTLSRKKRDVVNAFDENRHIEFRCSYQLTGLGLAKCAEDYGTKHKKLKGDMNHSLCRGHDTVLDDTETAYCINDVVVLREFIQILLGLEEYGGKEISYNNFPLTKTGLVRNDLRKRRDSYSQEDKKKINRLLNSGFHIDANKYRLCRAIFQGGYTHAFICNKERSENGIKLNSYLKRIQSFDKTSDYPEQMLKHKYPMTSFCKLTRLEYVKFFEERKATNCKYDNHAYIINMTLGNVKSKTPVSYISKCKWEKSIVNGKYDNGKMYSCDSIRLSVTEYDFEIILNNYSFETIEIEDIFYSKKDYLPKYIIEAAEKYYRKKTNLKGIDGEEVSYVLFKQLLNSIYGVTVQDPCKPSFCFSSDSEAEDNWEKTILEKDEDIEKKINSARNLVKYPWGVWVTAYARYELISAINKIDPEDIVYCDTDSIKYKARKKYTKLFDELNDEMIAEHEKAAEEIYEKYGIDVDLAPENKKHEKIEIGLWDNEGCYKYFKALGSKRYMWYKIYYDKKKKKLCSKFEITCCGIAKKSILAHILNKVGINEEDITPELEEDKILKVFEEFTDGLSIQGGYDSNGESLTGKMTHKYFDNKSFTETIIDHNGVTMDVHADNYITLTPSDFNLNANEDYFEFNDIFDYIHDELFD